MKETTIVREFPVSAERLFQALADQEGMGAWLGARFSVPVRGAQGLPGTVRRVHLGPVTFDERILAAEPPHSITYELVPPLPLLRHHRGQMRVEPLGPERSRLVWHIVLDLKLGASALVVPAVNRILTFALGRLERQLAA